MKKRRKRIFGFEYLDSIGKLVLVLRNRRGETIAYQMYNEKNGKHQLIKFRHD